MVSATSTMRSTPSGAKSRISSGARPCGELSLFVGAHRGDHARAAVLGELDGGVADGTRPSGHQHGGAVDRAVAEQRPVSGEERDAERGADLEARRTERDRLPGRDDDVLGRGAGRAPERRVEHPHALALAHRIDALADAIDLAGAVLARDLVLEADGAAAEPGAGLGVGRVDPGGAQADAHFARPRLGVGQLDQLENIVGRTGASVERSEHPADPMVELDRRHVWHPHAPMLAPLRVVSAEGVRLRLAGGRRLP